MKARDLRQPIEQQRVQRPDHLAAEFHGRTLSVRDITYSKWRIYGQPTRVIFDEMRIASGPDKLADVSPVAR